MYGGTLRIFIRDFYATGLSPRVRGNPKQDICESRIGGSIPACTGEPEALEEPWLDPTVYPRVYGGTDEPWMGIPGHQGLSPRVRGNPRLGQVGESARGSIPACTGEPNPIRQRRRDGEVYPRVYGGTARRLLQWVWGAGLSPRVRGNLPGDTNTVAVTRSIPACTGEPPASFARSEERKVYPRVYGGTDWALISER